LRKDGKTSYIVHILNVHGLVREALNFAQVFDRAITQIAALLHDTLEDEKATEKEIQDLLKELGQELMTKVLNIVRELTEKDKKKQMVRALKYSQEARLIKVADRVDNTPTSTGMIPIEWTNEKVNGYVLDGMVIVHNCRRKELDDSQFDAAFRYAEKEFERSISAAKEIGLIDCEYDGEGND
jgi:guanosine-3',5'-bis(diphosphate) 3'-pyrophosphohydrolase